MYPSCRNAVLALPILALMSASVPSCLSMILSKWVTIGTWNVSTMHEIEKTAQIVAEMKNYNLTLLRISETRWTQS